MQDTVGAMKGGMGRLDNTKQIFRKKTQNSGQLYQIVCPAHTFMVGVCAILFCVTVDIVLGKMPAVVWALTVCWVWLGDKTRLAAGLTSAGPEETHVTFYLNNQIIKGKRWSTLAKHPSEVILPQHRTCSHSYLFWKMLSAGWCGELFSSSLQKRRPR